MPGPRHIPTVQATVPGLVAATALAASAPAAAAEMLVSAAHLSWWIAAALTAAGAAGWAGWAIARQQERQRHQRASAAIGRELAAWQRLHGEALVWRSDGTGRLQHVAGAVPDGLPADWREHRLTELLATTVAPTLAERLAHEAPIEALAVRSAPKGQELRLSASPLHDAGGRLQAWIGLLQATGPSPAAAGDRPAVTTPAAEAAAAAPAASAPSASEEALSFSYTVSHDLRAPLRVVEGFARILKEDHGAQLDRVGNDHLDRVLGAAARMNQMIDALLALARLTAQPLARQPVDLSQLAQFVIDDLRRGAPERQIDVRIEPGMLAHGDPTLLRQVVENLIGNAWKYTQRTDAPTLVFERGRADGQPCYVVRDNGAGFDMRGADRLFGLFQRLHSASEFPGTGVGLASVKRIILRHGGHIWARSEPGQGAIFSFTLAE